MVQWFNIKRDLLNPGLNYWFSSGQKPNLEPNLGSVQFGLGSNHGSELSLTITKHVYESESTVDLRKAHL